MWPRQQRTARRSTIRRQLGAVSLAGLCLFGLNYFVAERALANADADLVQLKVISEAMRYHQDLDMQHDALHAAVRLAFVEPSAASVTSPQTELIDIGANVAADLAGLDRLELPAVLDRLIDEGRFAYQSLLTAANDTLGRVVDGPEALSIYDIESDKVEEVLAGITESLAAALTEARAVSAAGIASARLQSLFGAAIGAVLLIGITIVVRRSITRSLRLLGSVAETMSTGDLVVRASEGGAVEIAQLAQSFNALADSLQEMIGRLEADAQRDSFGTRLTEALEMADTEAEAFEMISLAMSEIDPTLPMEMLVADSSNAHLERAALSPQAGAPCCDVESPWSCVAVRRGHAVSFESSRALNACPHLRNRPGSDCSAACVPVSFMGKALGVLHTTAPDGEPPDAEQIQRLTTLATLGGTRIGTVRAFTRTQLHATTDGLTGLTNRRDAEERLRSLVLQQTTAAVVMADLDRFKMLNDTFGHETGDRALRVFSQTISEVVRDGDLVARWGGEEFLLVFPGLDRWAAVEVIDRIRMQLDLALSGGGVPPFTASFGVSDTTLSYEVAQLIRMADDALYKAKDAGRNCAIVAEDSSASIRMERRPSEPGAGIDQAMNASI